MNVSTDTEIMYLKGVGEKRAALYRELNISAVGDLLRHLPRDYIDLTAPVTVAGAPLGERCAVRATVLKKGAEARIKKGLSIWKVQIGDDSGVMTLSFFNTRYAVMGLKEGESYLFYGRAEGTLLRREMSAPMVFPEGEAGGLFPVYPLTAGLTSRGIATNVRTALSLLPDSLSDPLPVAVRQKFGLCDSLYAFRAIHFPRSTTEAAIARRRFIFEELLTLSLALMWLRRGSSALKAPAFPAPNWEKFYKALPFTLTGAQKRAISDIAGDMSSGKMMNRLLQGDVGSGKTVVAAAGMAMAARAGAQAAMMAPTEILAAQHYNSLSGLLGQFNISCGLLTGSTPAAEKRRIKKALAAGHIDVIIGTHALITGDVSFNNLGLVVTDEQHRFGVSQRATFTAKGEGVHTLVMSATPIPRTLSLMIYGDLDLSVIDELPAGRRPIETYLIDTEKRERAYNYIKKHLDKGLQGYIICPLVEENPDLPELIPATTYAEQLQKGPFKNYKVGLLHGKMKPKDKTAAMQSFYSGETDLLVATTVVEVGVDVKNAVIMLIESADRFGLGQLHQLRGRIGRGSVRSTCILISDSKSPLAKERLDTLRRSQNGFEIAETDLRLRGPGDFFGQRQHGLPPLKIADLADDMALLEAAQQTAGSLLAADPQLSAPEHRALNKQVKALFSKIGAAPN